MSELNQTANTLDDAAGRLNTVAAMAWDDAQGEQFRSLVQKIAQQIKRPVEPLRTAQPKLEKLASAIDYYSRIKF